MDNNSVNAILTALGGVGEMAHQVYTSMISAGAGKAEATAGMSAWIMAFWHEANEDARRKGGQGYE